MSKGEHKKNLVAGFIRENPLFVSLLGLCPALAVTKSVEAALGMGVLFSAVLICSNVLVSLLRKVIPEEIRTPCFIVIIATFVTLTKMLTEAFLPELYSTLGVFLSLLVVNCVILGRSEAFASKNGVLDSFLDGVGNGIGFTIAILIIALFREVLGTGQLAFGNTFTFIADANGGEAIRLPILKGEGYDVSFSVFTTPAGGFLILGIVLAVVAAIQNYKKNKKKVDERIAKAKAKASASAKTEEAK